nr:hypothetical protein [Subtercola boreus]
MSTQSELFRERWASRDVVFPSEPDLVMNVTAPADSPTADAWS